MKQTTKEIKNVVLGQVFYFFQCLPWFGQSLLWMVVWLLRSCYTTKSSALITPRYLFKRNSIQFYVFFKG